MPGKFLRDDLDCFFNAEDFADLANWQGRTFPVQFFNEYDASVIFGMEIESASPYILVKDSDIPGISHGVAVTIGTAPADSSYQSDKDGLFISDASGEFDASVQSQYIVRGIQPNNTGITKLILSRN